MGPTVSMQKLCCNGSAADERKRLIQQSRLGNNGKDKDIGSIVFSRCQAEIEVSTKGFITVQEVGRLQQRLLFMVLAVR